MGLFQGGGGDNLAERTERRGGRSSWRFSFRTFFSARLS